MTQQHYESWRISYQSSESAARAAWEEMTRLQLRGQELVSEMAAIGAGGVEPLRKPAAVTASERELFEAVASDSGKWPKAIERDAKGNHLLLTTANGWMWWREARAAPASNSAEFDGIKTATPVVLPEPDFWVRPAATIHPDRGWQCWSNDGTATGAFHADTVRALLAGVSAPTDPMDWPLPCDVTVGGGTMGKGVKLRTLVLRMKVLYKMATGHDADEVANRTPEQSSALLAKFQARIEGNDTGDLSAQSAQAEPVAWLRTHKLGGVQAFTTEPPPGLKEQCQPLYTAPQAQADARDADQERWMEIGKAIERACIDQPDSTEIVISLERDAGTVTMFDPDGNEHDQFSHEDGFAGVVNAAIDAAIAAQAKQGGAA